MLLYMSNNKKNNSNTLKGLTVIGKIKLPVKKRREFKPFSGGATIGQYLAAKGVSLA